ncbi:MAG: hypothetical protein ACRDRH_13430 [Pseudonocardia sp.]
MTAAMPDKIVPTWSFGDRVRKIRRDVLRVDQAQFAQQLGVTAQAASAWEAQRSATQRRGTRAAHRNAHRGTGDVGACLDDYPVKPVEAEPASEGADGAASATERGQDPCRINAT